jgi:hypothetical protein
MSGLSIDPFFMRGRKLHLTAFFVIMTVMIVIITAVVVENAMTRVH